MISPADHREEGFALLETVVALLILAIALGVASYTISTSLATVRRSQDLTAGTEVLHQLASTELEAIRQAGTKTGKLGSGVEWEVRVEALGSRNEPPLYLVTVRVRPRGKAGTELLYKTFSGGATTGDGTQ